MDFEKSLPQQEDRRSVLTTLADYHPSIEFADSRYVAEITGNVRDFGTLKLKIYSITLLAASKRSSAA